MSIDVGGSGNIAVSEPLLNLLHRHTLLEQQARAAVTKIMEADLPQAMAFQKLCKCPGHIIRQNEVSHLIHEQISFKFPIVAVAAELLVSGLLRFKLPQAIGESGDKRQRAQTGFCFGTVGLHQDALPVNADVRHDMADGQRTGFKIHRFPPQAQHFPSAQPIKGRELNDEFQLMSARRLKQLLQLLSRVIGRQIFLRLGTFHLVHRIARNQIQLNRIFQRLVQICMEAQNACGFERFQLVQVKTLDMTRPKLSQRDFGRLKVRNDVILHIEAIGGPCGFLHR